MNKHDRRNNRPATLAAPPDPAADSQFWQIPVSLPEGDFLAHLIEPAGTSALQLLRQLRSGKYAKPFVLEDDEYRQLHFSLRFTQSRMRIRKPDALALAYTRKMMAFLPFIPTPRHVMIVGLGGGSLTKFCYRQMPRARITTIEIDRTVIELARLFHVPAPDTRLRLVEAEAAGYLATTRQSADVILVDGCDQHGIAPTLCGESFYATARARLRPGGVLVVNFIGTAGRSELLLRSLAKVFDEQVLVLPVPGGGNRIAFAFCKPTWPPDWAEIRQQASVLGQQYGLDLPGFTKQLEAGARRKAAR